MEFNKPGPNKRVCAFFIDSVIGEISGGVISLILAVNLSWIIWAAFILFKDCFNGQSVGKYLVGTQVIDENSLPAKPSKTIIRNIFMIIPIFPLVEYIVMLRDKGEGKRIGDKATRTRVNDLKPHIKDNIFLLVSVLLAIALVVVQIGIFALLMAMHPGLIKC
jgi:uncharacterized RDD family membrane protein YckC